MQYFTRRISSFARPFIPLISETGFPGAVGNTPLIKLNNLSKETGCNIFAKGEYMNPGGSVKDRAALWIIEDAEKRGQIRAGGTIVEGTAGNTGIGLAHICRARGYKCVIYMPEVQAQNKIDMLRLLGAEVHLVPVVPFSDPMNFNHQAKRHAESIDNAVWTDQFDNLANRQSHIDSTGPEIWAQTNGTIDAFTCSTGTGGSLGGTGRYLKDISDGRVKVYLADPPGSVLYKYVKEGKLERTGDGSITEGIGQGRLTNNLGADIDIIDDALYIPDSETIKMIYRLLDEEGIFIGASSCLNVVAARDVAKRLGPGHTVVTLMCDSAERYASRLFSKSWLKSKGIYDDVPEHLKKYTILE